MNPHPDRLLYLEAELPEALQLTPDQINKLVRTGQLRPIRIAGETRFHSHELNALIETYKQIARRKEPHDHSIQ